MKQEQFNELLIEALNNTEIVEKIKSSLSSQQADPLSQPLPENYAELERLNNQIKTLTQEVSDSRESLQKANEKISSLNTENNDLKIQIKNISQLSERQKAEKEALEKELKECRHETEIAVNEAEALRGEFGEVISVYNTYLTLDKTTKRNLSNIINCSNILLFIMSCSEYDNLQRLWDYNKTLAVGGDFEKLSVLKRVFDFFFSGYNSSRQPSRFVLDTTKAGDVFDDDEHIRGFDSKVSGRITEVVLYGYRNATTGRIEKKSVVVVKGYK